MSSKLKIFIAAGLALAGLWGFWFFQTERDYGTRSREQNLGEFKIPGATTPEQVAFVRGLAKKDDEEFFGLTDRISFSNYPRLIYFEYVQALGENQTDRRKQRLQEIAAKDDADGAAHAKLMLLKGSEKDQWPAKAGDLLQTLEATTTEGRIHLFNRLLNQMGEDKVWLKDLRGYIYKSKHNETVALGLRHLATLKDKWVGDNIDYFVKHQDPEVRAAAIQSLSSFCSEKTEKLLSEAAKSERNSQVLVRIVDEVLEFPKVDLQAAYAEIAEKASGDTQIRNKIKENLARNRAGQVRPACTTY